MKKAAWIVATHYRPKLLSVALASIQANACPEGWSVSVVVCCMQDDQRAQEICRVLEVRCVSDSGRLLETGASKRNRALACAGDVDLILVADDDDIQAPHRLELAIRALECGNAISETKEFRYLHADTGSVVRWCGRGSQSRPPVAVGTARNYKRTLLARVGGWKPYLTRLIEKDIQARIAARLPGASSRAKELYDLADATICIQHASNIWDDRPTVLKGETLQRGDYTLVGEGHWSEISEFPHQYALLLGLPH